MKRNEIEIVRALSIKLSEDLVFILTYQYHTEKSESDPAGQKNAREKSRYRMLGRIERISDIEKKIQELHVDSNRLNPWKWPDDPSWDGNILYMKDASNEACSNWLRLKLRKMVSEQEGVFLMKGFKKNTQKANELKKRNKKIRPEEIYTEFTKNAVYDTKGYMCSDGSIIDIDDFDALRTKVGQNVWKEIQMKLVGPKGAKPFQGNNKAEAILAEGEKEPEIVATT